MHVLKQKKYKFLAVLLLWLCILHIFDPVEKVFSQTGYPLTAISGADGKFDIVVIDGDTVYRSKGSKDSYQLYMYFQTDIEIRSATAYVEVRYKDIGYGLLGIQYNSTTHDYQNATFRRQNYVQNTNGEKTALFVLENADFRDAQNLDADMRLNVDSSLQMHIVSVIVYLEPSPLYQLFKEDWISPYEGQEYFGDKLVDATTLNGKVICGYQGWFRASGDPSGQGWIHYDRSNDFTDLTIEMWPDMLELTEEEKYPVPHWSHANGEQAYLFSSANKKTVIRHFQWMETYGIDGVAIQRQAGDLYPSHPHESFRIPGYAREAANRTGRTYYIMYCGIDVSNLTEAVSDDWQYLVDTMKITDDDRYLHHNGKPVVGIYGFFTNDLAITDANNVLDIFQSGGQYEAYVVGSGEWWWRTETEDSAPGWPQVFRRMDAWIPWNVGHYSGEYANTDQWLVDKNEMDSCGVLYMPLVYPGFGWDNLKNKPPGTTNKPRLQGDFLWQQFLDAKELEAQAVYVAMFDEIDESTAIFKVTNDIPVNHYFLTLEGLPSDFYLLMTGYGTGIINGTFDVPNEIPDFAIQSQPSIPDLLSPVYGATVMNPVSITWSAVEHLSEITGYELEIDGQAMSVTTTEEFVNLSEGLHTIQVRAINSLNIKGGLSEAVVFTVLPPNAEIRPPTDVVVTVVANDHGHSLQLTWTLSPDDAIVSYYEIFRSRNREISDIILHLDEIESQQALIEAEMSSTILVCAVDAGISTFIDQTLPEAEFTYYYWLQAVSDIGVSKKVAARYMSTEIGEKSMKFSLLQAYPNPFNPVTTISYSIPNDGQVHLAVYDILGREVAVLVDSHVSAGSHNIEWDAAQMAGGLYFYRIQAGDFVETRKMLYLK